MGKPFLMNKRLFTFFFSVLISISIVQIYFQHDRDKKQQKELEIYKEKMQQYKKEVEEKTLSLDALPTVKIFRDSTQKDFFTHGIRGENFVVCFPSGKNTPSKIVVEGSPYFLRYEQKNLLDSPLIYTLQPQEKLQLPPLESLDSTNLQVITLGPEKEKMAVYLAKTSQGNFFYHLKNPSSHAIALAFIKGQWKAVGMVNLEKRLSVFQDLPNIYPLIENTSAENTSTNSSKKQAYYVLQTPYQQLVFSNHGGSLVEINLPFEDSANTKSFVKEIEVDRSIFSQAGPQAFYPLHAYYTAGDNPQGPHKLNENLTQGNHYPLLRRRVNLENKSQSFATMGLNLSSKFPEISKQVYGVESFSPKHITFVSRQAHRKIKKTFYLPTEDAPYCFNLRLEIEGDNQGLYLTSGLPEAEMISGSAQPILKYRISKKEEGQVKTIDLPKEGQDVQDAFNEPDWLLSSNGFFGILIDPLKNIAPGFRAQYISGLTHPSRLTLVENMERYSDKDFPAYQILLPLKKQQRLSEFRIYAGPLVDTALSQCDHVFSNSQTGYTPDYKGTQSYHGFFSFISAPFAKFLMILMKFFHSVTQSWALSIVLLTVALRLMLYPLNAWSMKSMRRMQLIAPKVTQIQEKYKNKPQKMQMEVMNLYRDHKVNPFSGCLPLLIQMPFLVGMFDLLKTSFELRGAPFIPNWIENLTAPDVLFQFGFALPYFGSEFHLLPVLSAVIMYVQQKMNMKDKKKTASTEQEAQQKMTMNVMTVMMAVMFYHMPSGLNLYFLSSMLLGIAQQAWINRGIKNAPPQGVLEVVK